MHSSCDAAHALVAVVFMGSEKYPDENDFDAFLKLHGGFSNAYTDCERVRDLNIPLHLPPQSTLMNGVIYRSDWSSGYSEQKFV